MTSADQPQERGGAFEDVIWLRDQLATLTAERDLCRERERRLNQEANALTADLTSAREVGKKLAQAGKQFLEERDQARAQCERIKAVVDEQAKDEGLWFRAQTAAEKEVQRLTKDLASARHDRDFWLAETDKYRTALANLSDCPDAIVQRDQARAQCEQLRAALFKIADDSSHSDQYVKWARAALDQQAQPG